MGTSYTRGCTVRKKKIKTNQKSNLKDTIMYARDTRDTRARRPYQI